MAMLACLEMRRQRENLTELITECLAPFNESDSDISPYDVYKRLDVFCKKNSLLMPEVEIHLRRLLEPYVDLYMSKI